MKAPGKYYRKGLSLISVMKLFPDDKTAEDQATLKLQF